MTRSILKRRDEYERKAEKRAKFREAVTAVIAGAVLITAMIAAPIIGSAMKKQQVLPAADGTSSTESTERSNGYDVTDEYVVLKNALDFYPDSVFESIFQNKIQLKVPYLAEDGAVKGTAALYDSPNNIQHTSDVKTEKRDIVGKKHEEVSECAIEVSPDPRYTRWVTVLWVGEGIELLTSENYFYFEGTGEEIQKINIQVAFKEGKTFGAIQVYVFGGDTKIELFEQKYKDKSDELLSNPYTVESSRKNNLFLVNVKGYDYWWYSYEDVYREVAIYNGDIDENGNPIYESDFYNKDYYDYPKSEERRRNEIIK